MLEDQTAQDDFTICNSDLAQVAYSTVLRAIEDTDSDPFSMTIRCSIEWAAIAQCVNQGIDSHLEAICDPNDVFDNGTCSVSRGRCMRLVENEDDWHFKQQMMRYGSGLHLTIDRQSELDDQVGYGLIKLTDTPVHIYRRSFDFSGALGWPQDRLDRLVQTVDSIRAMDGVTLDTRNGGLCYSVEVHGNKGLFDHTVALLGDFKTGQ